MPPQEIFLSHSSADRIIADSVVATLRNHGNPVWYSQTNILGAQQWHDEIGKALKRCDWFVVILSPDSVKSMIDFSGNLDDGFRELLRTWGIGYRN